MKKRWYQGAIVMLFAVALVVTGCGSKTSSKEAIQGAYTKSLEMKSYAFKSTVKVDDLQLTGANFEGQQSAMMAGLLKNSELTVSGVAQNEPLQVEATLDVDIKGDMAFKFSLPFSMTAEKMYVKVPNIPMLAGMIPQEIVGKFLELDYKKLAEEQGQAFDMSSANIQTSQKFGNEFFKEVVSKFDEKTYFTDVAVKDAGLPEGVDAKQVVKFAVTNENFDQAATTFVKDALPALLDLMSKEEYRKIFQLEASEIEKAKTELNASDSELKKGLEEMKKSLKVNELSVTTAINKEGFPAYQTFVGNLDFNEADENVKLALRVTTETSNINGKQEFKIGVPKDAIPMDQLEQMFGGGM
ncbi:hypothetical protein [Paenibacillus taiwanensis]|uniref:hypothetical protein n=1 Tax=Paenibacillus taiwanensis TaxID=401638 RepID=UPI00040CA320|nr:hypothetical protein [Paenibacillus taiwanensis]